jgi:hypothetical protein
MIAPIRLLLQPSLAALPAADLPSLPYLQPIDNLLLRLQLCRHLTALPAVNQPTFAAPPAAPLSTSTALPAVNRLLLLRLQ